MFSKNLLSRRNFLVLAGASGAGLLEGCSKSRRPVETTYTAIEILERQHGINRRALAILDTIKNEINAQMDISPEIAGGAVGVIETFMIKCHQLMEEKFVFPAFAGTQKTADLIAVLRKQHDAASKLTGILKPLCVNFSQNDEEKRRETVKMIHLLTRMSQAHESWEDTTLFPLLRVVDPGKSYARLSSEVQAAETNLIGRDGLDETLQKIASYENGLGIGNLASFTPTPEDLS
ncbi:MAG: hemerythrin domain-containing protein [Deltaproteobacteria bacterium]|jgi:hemerythrin-like domain-containing protein|nr:hemerythrin domain-containing protein [Deltaproteobacteria bacterium]